MSPSWIANSASLPGTLVHTRVWVLLCLFKFLGYRLLQAAIAQGIDVPARRLWCEQGYSPNFLSLISPYIATAASGGRQDLVVYCDSDPYYNHAL
ncbi:uncharacterized protein EI90DRAFT_2657974 [Cantharellus anzutake]|uniref:uncharacterized protein n=1 Tax=Cantharellus anzutake TaxID=1750568 RepID=UPI00190883FC|nr:uncharacterized protein EI90DRAFT_2657974 [Cantharellus anzutake]KAF8337495.1 hypothetical protein EI90DRAFT_2657974 [Cantharellus anzutake]